MNQDITRLFLDLLRVSLGTISKLTTAPTDEEWEILYKKAQEHAIIGVMFNGVEKRPDEQRPPKQLILQWYSMVSAIERKNQLLNVRCRQVTERFLADNIQTCVLKGQGNARLYPNSLRRQSGDIDIWVNMRPKDAINYVKKHCKNWTELRYHHIAMPLKDVMVEVHFRPAFMDSFVRNHRFQKWAAAAKPIQMQNYSEKDIDKSFHVPTTEFNLIYQLVHIFRHLFDEGIGLRQLIDYYYLLKSVNPDDEHLKQQTVVVLKKLGLRKFAGAMMWVMGNLMGLDKKHMYLEPNEKEGRFLLDEVMMAGNFGKYDPRFGDLTGESTWHHFWRKIKRNMRFLKSYPEEVISEPFFRIYHWGWRLFA